jgi:hypothetical protein
MCKKFEQRIVNVYFPFSASTKMKLMKWGGDGMSFNGEGFGNFVY